MINIIITRIFELFIYGLGIIIVSSLCEKFNVSRLKCVCCGWLASVIILTFTRGLNEW
ncbi:MAG: hypothetical protein Ta2B_09320 [Termitinemataceae bacterium]|nr:MAG: hypothetical protein Ta2B_09320 [Termitinemataceae bacterium]